MAAAAGWADDAAMRRRPFALTLTLAAALTLAACGGSSDDDGSTPSDPPVSGTETDGTTDGDVTEALEGALPEGTVDVPSEEGATTIAEWAAGGSSVEPADPTELTQILAMVGTDADGYFTDDAIVVRTTEADAALLCGTVEGLDIDSYQVIPVLPDGTGVDCAA